MRHADAPDALADAYASVPPQAAPRPSVARWLWPLGVLLLLGAAVVAESQRSPEDAPWLFAGLMLGVVLVGGLSLVLAGVAWARSWIATVVFLALVLGVGMLAIELVGANHSTRVLRLAGVIGVVCVAFPANAAVRARTLRLCVALILLAFIAAGDLIAAAGFLRVGLGFVAVLAIFALRDVLRSEDEPVLPRAVSTAPALAPEPDLQAPGEPSYADLKRELAQHKELENQLTRAKQEAEAAVMAKGEFLATMSHEIRTPLNGIIPLLDIVLSTQLAVDQRDYLVTAYQSAKQLLGIVDDILDYSKIEANKVELETVGINLKEILESVTRLLHKGAESKGLKLAIGIDPNVRLAMRGDPTRLRQVLTNLVSNAIKFTERGTITIEVKKRGENRSHADVLFSVTDTGIGIASDQQARLFKPFTQADASTTRMHGGTGLGLVICKRLIDLMGGQLGVRSELGKGSSFWFSVPLLKALGDVAPARSDIHGSRALIVSTDAQLARRLAGHFSGWAMQYVQTSVAAEALAKLRSAANMAGNWTYDFLVLDWGSMKNTALSLARNVLRDAALERIRVVAVSGEEEIPAELRGSARIAVFSRQVGDVELRAGMQRLLDASAHEIPAGATVEALLPELKPPPPAASAPVPAPGAGAAAAPPGAVAQALGGHVLLVEDNAVNRQVAQRLLSLVGVSFEIAENGKQALDRLEQSRFDAILMDCMMPILDGYGAARAVRKLEQEGRRQGHLPIIAMTANAMAGDREKCIAAGMDDYMSKPLNRAVLEQMLRKWLPAGAIARPAANAAPARSDVPGGAPAALPERRSEPVAELHRAAVRPTTPPPSATPMGGRAPAAYAAPTRRGSAVDQDVVQDLLEMMGAEFTELVRVYLEDTPKSLGVLERAAQQGDIESLIAPSHSLKSTSANLGALALSEMAKRIEHGARQGALPGEPVLLVAELSAEFQRVAGELRRMLASAPT